MTAATRNPVLYRPSDIAEVTAELTHITQVAAWCDTFLSQPHPDLGRSGPVCPFMPKAIRIQTISFVVVRTLGRSEADVDQVISGFRDVFFELEPTSGPEAKEKAIIVILPDVSEAEAATVVDETHRRLKQQFVELGLMIGKFHPGSPQGGLHNPDFRPLRSPVPLLAIRHMVDSDLPFLNRVDDPAADRVKFLEAYGRRHADSESSLWSQRGRAALDQIHDDAQLPRADSQEDRK
jgi:Domain of unknown function (DUF6875)